MVEITELEDLCKSQYNRFLYIRKRNSMTFDSFEPRGDFLVASKAKEEMIKNDHETQHKESYAVYFVVPYKDGRIGDNTFLIEAASQEEFDWDMGTHEGTRSEKTYLAIRQKDDYKDNHFAYVSADKYYNVADKTQLARLINNSDETIYFSMQTHDEKDYSDEPSPLRKKLATSKILGNYVSYKDTKKVKKAKQEDIDINLARIANAYTSFIGYEADLEDEKLRGREERLRLRAEESKKEMAELRSKIKARIRKPLDRISEAIDNAGIRRGDTKDNTSSVFHNSRCNE